MLKNTKWYLPVLAAVLLVTAACTNDALDDGTGADVVLEIVSLENPPITAQQSQGEGEATCTLQVEDWTATIEAAPKNSLAGTPPFNDIILHSVTITYNWIDAGLSTPTRTVGLGDTRIPAGAISSIRPPTDWQRDCSPWVSSRAIRSPSCLKTALNIRSSSMPWPSAVRSWCRLTSAMRKMN